MLMAECVYSERYDRPEQEKDERIGPEKDELGH
jgi:hypothetical protein